MVSSPEGMNVIGAVIGSASVNETLNETMTATETAINLVQARVTDGVLPLLLLSVIWVWRRDGVMRGEEDRELMRGIGREDKMGGGNGVPDDLEMRGEGVWFKRENWRKECKI